MHHHLQYCTTTDQQDLMVLPAVPLFSSHLLYHFCIFLLPAFMSVAVLFLPSSSQIHKTGGFYYCPCSLTICYIIFWHCFLTSIHSSSFLHSLTLSPLLFSFYVPALFGQVFTSLLAFFHNLLSLTIFHVISLFFFFCNSILAFIDKFWHYSCFPSPTFILVFSFFSYHFFLFHQLFSHPSCLFL